MRSDAIADLITPLKTPAALNAPLRRGKMAAAREPC